MSKKKDYIRYLEENIGATGGLDNTRIVNISDPVISSDAFLDPNAPVLHMYANGDGFRINDNASLYEVIKIFRDFTDKAPLLQSMTYAIDTNNRYIKFTVVTDNDHNITEELLNGFLTTLKSEIARKFGDNFEFYSEQKDIMGDIGQNIGYGPSQGKKQLTIIVSEKKASASSDKEVTDVEKTLDSINDLGGQEIGSEK